MIKIECTEMEKISLLEIFKDSLLCIYDHDGSGNVGCDGGCDTCAERSIEWKIVD